MQKAALMVSEAFSELPPYYLCSHPSYSSPCLLCFISLAAFSGMLLPALWFHITGILCSHIYKQAWPEPLPFFFFSSRFLLKCYPCKRSLPQPSTMKSSTSNLRDSFSLFPISMLLLTLSIINILYRYM